MRNACRYTHLIMSIFNNTAILQHFPRQVDSVLFLCFQIEEVFFGGEAAAVAGEGVVAAYDAVARGED